MGYRADLRQQHQLLFLVSFVAIGIVAINFLFENEIYESFGLKNHMAAHLLFEFFIIFFSFAIAVQTWLGAMFHPNFKRILIGALFLAIGVFEGFHTLSYNGMPFFINETNPNISAWFTTVQRFLIPIGFMVIYSLKDKEVDSTYAHTVFVLTLLSSVFISLIYYSEIVGAPLLILANGGSTLTKDVLHLLFMLLNVLAIVVIWQRRATIDHNVQLLISGVVFLMFSELMDLFYKRMFDVYIFSAHVFHLASFALLFFAIYYSQVRKPFLDLMSAHESLEKSEREMKQIAYYDTETGLQNERYLKEDLHRELHGKEAKALVIFSIDRFSQLKSTLGKAQTVTLMKQISKRITRVLEDPYCFYKLDSDRFVIYLYRVHDEEEIKQLVEMLQNVVKEPLSLSHFSMNISFRFGVSMYPTDATSVEELIQYAVFALYESENQKTEITYFNAEMQKAREKRMRFENDLKYALNGELFLEYQPQLDFKTGEISSMEALIRWRHPEKGLISPFEFIPIAEESGLIVPIGNWVLEKACRDTVALQKKLGKRMRVAVNLSIGQMYNEELVSDVARVLVETGIEPSDLQLEITESMSENIQQIIPVLKELKGLGVTIAMDDFGTGYSSLSYLKEFPIDVLKIDRSFVWNILESEKDEALVRMIISMAKHLGLQVVAEGIENLAQLRYLSNHSCDKIQGYYISRPIPLKQLETNFVKLQAFATEQMEQIQVVQ